MKLKDLLGDQKVDITYRTHYLGRDMLVGFCFWDGSELTAIDGDSYSVEDEISSYEWDTPSNLTVWYESKWIEG